MECVQITKVIRAYTILRLLSSLNKHLRRLLGVGRMGGRERELGMDMYRLLYLKSITYCIKPTIQHRELCSMLCGSLDERGVWRRMDTRICMAESFRCPP